MRFNIVIYQKFRNYKFTGLAELKISETKVKVYYVFMDKTNEKMNFLYMVASPIKSSSK